jgi:ABC-type antimicrobial peptide transport system permease subunit
VISITLRRLIRHWQINLVILLSLAFGTSIMISLSGYGAFISNQELQRAFALASPAGRSLLITGSLNTFDATLYKHLQNSLGVALKERIEIRYATLQADPQPEGRPVFNSIDVYSFDPIAGHVQIVEGRLPEPLRLSESTGSAPPQVEAVIGLHAAEQAGYHIGDRVTASGSYHRFKIVGIIEPLDVNDDAWGGDLNAFQITGDTTLEDRVLPVIISPVSMRSNLLRPIFPHQIRWRITLNRENIPSDKVENLRVNLINFESQAGTRGAVVTSDLIKIFDDHQAELSPVHTLLFLLYLQSMIILLLALAALASTKKQSSQTELSTYSARGASPWQIFSPFVLEAFIISMLAALICGPGLAQVIILLGSRDFNAFVLHPLPGNTWLIAVILAIAGWLALTLPFLSAPRLEPVRNRLPQQSRMQRYSLDVYLLVLGSLLTWQLRQSGSFLTRQLGNNARFFDPLLVAGPSLMLAACAMLAIRLLPLLAPFISRVAGRFQGSVFHFGFLRLTRDARHSGWILLLAGLVSAQCTFNRVFAATLDSNPAMTAVPSLAPEIGKLLRINTLSLILFTFSLFFLLSLFRVQQRLEQFQVLRTLGLSPFQGWITLNIEDLPSLLLGVVVGAILGLGLLFALFPYLTQAFGKVVIGPPKMDWWSLAKLYAILFLTFGAALLLPLARMNVKGLGISPQTAE